MLEAYITNLGKYNEGRLVGEFLRFPTATEDVQALLKRIHIDGLRYEEIFITDYETDIPGLYDLLGEYESIDELNYLAALLEDLNEWEMDKFTAAVDFGDCKSVKDLINLVQNLDCFELFTGIENEEDLGRYYIDEMCSLEVPEHLKSYLDYEAYGRDMSIDEDGRFTNGSYVVRTGERMTEHYADRDDIPDEYKVFAYPKPEPSIKKALEIYRQMACEAPISSRGHPAPDHADR